MPTSLLLRGSTGHYLLELRGRIDRWLHIRSHMESRMLVLLYNDPCEEGSNGSIARLGGVVVEKSRAKSRLIVCGMIP